MSSRSVMIKSSPARDRIPRPLCVCKNAVMTELTQAVESRERLRGLVDESTAEKDRRVAVVTYAITIFLSAFLLFQVQLIIGKYILPLYGGAPAVWTTCMLCFQVLLLVGYGYAHILGTWSQRQWQGKVHSALLCVSLCVLAILWVKWGSPLTPGGNWKPQPGADPVWNILKMLGATVALPFFLLATTGPLLQKWFSSCSAEKSPYRFYALSNAGSLLGLLSYPFFVEWLFVIRHQAWLWSIGYILFAVFAVVIAWRFSNPPPAQQIARGKQSRASREVGAPGLPKYLLWLGLSACSTTLLLASTNLLCQDIAVIPMLWVVPLSIYLISFILTFENQRWYQRKVFWPLYFLALGVGIKSSFDTSGETLFLIAMYCLTLFAVCMVCHGELARSKPATGHLTSFYLMVALGGALGGVFVVLLAPRLFLGFWEFQVALVACGILLFAAYLMEDPSARSERGLWTAALIILGTFFIPHLGNLLPLGPWRAFNNEYFAATLCVGGWLFHKFFGRKQLSKSRSSEHVHYPWQPIASILLLGLFAIVTYGYTQSPVPRTLFTERNFFGIKRLIGNPEDITLVSGTTMHGVQLKDPARRNTPTGYYATDSGIGLLLRNFPRGPNGQDHLRVGLIGMGAATLATYGQSGDYYRFYEIDPAVIQLSFAPRHAFFFVQDCPAKVVAVLGDARLSLENEAASADLQKFDVLAVDAFSSDTVPVHLLTQEAMGVYLRHMRGPDGVLAFHVSNRYLDLNPVILALAQNYNLSAVGVRGKSSKWILLSANPAMLQLPNLVEKAKPLAPGRRPILWTDGYSNLFQVLQRPGWQQD